MARFRARSDRSSRGGRKRRGRCGASSMARVAMQIKHTHADLSSSPSVQVQQIEACMPLASYSRLAAGARADIRGHKPAHLLRHRIMQHVCPPPLPTLRFVPFALYCPLPLGLDRSPFTHPAADPPPDPSTPPPSR